MENIRRLADTAMLAGELMLRSGADIYRVEDTMNRILDRDNTWWHEVVALPTALYLTVVIDRENSDKKETMSIVKRVESAGINLNTIYRVNHISRQLCLDKIGLEEAYEKLHSLDEFSEYPDWYEYLAYIFISHGFLIMMHGSFLQFILTSLAAMMMSITKYITTKKGFNAISINAASTFVMVVSALLFSKHIFAGLNTDVVIISCLVPLVPGVKCTTAVKDVLNGNYTSGMSRILEALVIALAVATGAGVAIALMGVLI